MDVLNCSVYKKSGLMDNHVRMDSTQREMKRTSPQGISKHCVGVLIG